MMTVWRTFCEDRYRSRFIVLLAIFLLWGGPLFAEGKAFSGTARTEGIPLTQISPDVAKEFLTRLNIGIVSRLPRTSTLLITAEASELQKAIAILDIVDTRTEFDIRQLGPASMAGTLPANERIADAVGGISIGTFASPPRDRTRMRGIIDVHDGAVIAIAPVFQLPDIQLAIQLGPEVLKQRKALAGSNDSAVIQQTVQAAAMGGASPDVSAMQKPGSRITGNQPGRFALSREMQRELDEVREHARLGIEHQPLSQPEIRATQFQALDLQQGSGTLSSDRSAADAAEVSLPAGLRQVGAAAREESGRLTEPVADEPAGLQPGQVVPADAVQVTQPQASPQQEPQRGAVDARTSDPTVQTKSATSPYSPPPFANGDQLINLTLPERVPIIELLDLVGKYLNLSYMYNPDEVKGDVVLKIGGQLQGQMTVKRLYDLLELGLKQNNLVATRYRDNIVVIASATRAVDIDPLLMDTAAVGVDAGNVVVTRTFELKHIDTLSAQNLLTTMRLGIDVTPVAERQLVIVTAYAHRMERIERLLQIVDQPGRPRKFKYRQLRYTMAKTLAEKVKALAEQLEGVSVTIGEPDIAGATVRQPNETDVQYRTRLAQIRAVQAAQIRAQAAARGQVVPEQKPGVYLDADERTNRILMIGLEAQLTVVDDLVDALDVEQQDLRALQLYRMRHVDADEVARKLQELGIISRLPETPTSGRITGTPRTTPVVPGQPRPAVPTPTPDVSLAAEVTQEGLVGEPQVVVVESTNSLLVNATPEQHAKITAIIEYVDSEMETEEIPYRIYPLENSSPEHLATILEGLIQETVEQDRDGKIEQTVVRREQRIQIVPDPNTYSLIVYASRKNHEWISSLVEQLDKRRPQVLIDVTLVEITKNDSFEYDLNVIQSFPDLLSTSGQVGGLPAGVLSALTAPGARDRFTDLESGKVVTGEQQFRGYYADRHIGALLTAMQRKQYGRVLAKPKILVNDNEPGTIKTLKTTYVETSTSIPVTTPGTGTQAPVPTFTTSVVFTAYEAGIEMNITPHISEGDLLRLVIELIRSDFTTSGGEKPPDKTGSELTTAVTVPDGSTVILGGMLDLRQDKHVGKVPLLGDLPFVGGLFRNVKNAGTESKLYVFVKAEIIRPAGTSAHGMRDLDQISQVNRDAFEKHELEFQQYQSWPGVKPKPLNPPKVLDAR